MMENNNEPIINKTDKELIDYAIKRKDLILFKKIVSCLIERQITPEQIRNCLYELENNQGYRPNDAKAKITEVFLHSLRRNYHVTI